MSSRAKTDARSLRVVVVDDEPPARDLLAQYLEELENVELIASCRDGFEAIKAVVEHEPDVLLLDIQMPKLSGFEVLELLESPPQVVFATAHDEFALRAFEVAAVDYLLKPIAIDRLSTALDRVRGRLEDEQTQPLERLLEAGRQDRERPARVLVRRGSEVHVLQPAEIDYVEARDDYVAIHCGERVHRKKQTLSSLEQSLSDEFVRIHRSFLLNLDRLQRIELYAKDSRVAFLADGTRLPVSRSGYDRLRRLL